MSLGTRGLFFDGVSAMGYIAAKTEKVIIASGILNIYSGTPSLMAMTAAGIDSLSEGACLVWALQAPGH